ncbi:MAG: DUF3418 domain-containing protein [Acidimicrobiales bacterium]
MIVHHGGPPWDEEGFSALLTAVRGDLAGTLETIVAAGRRRAGARRRVESHLAALTAPVFRSAVDDISAQLARLVRPGFVATVGTARLGDIGRYPAAVERPSRHPDRGRWPGTGPGWRRSRGWSRTTSG